MVDTGISREEVPLQGIRNSSLLTLIITPFIIAIIWQLENFLLAINPHLFSKANFPWLVLFTGTFVCYLWESLFPSCESRQLSFRERSTCSRLGSDQYAGTVIAVGITALAIYTFFVLTGASGGAIPFTFFLPTAVAAVMICWVLIGTHIQAYVRNGGAMISIFAGTLVTALIFALSMSILFIGPDFRQIFSAFLQQALYRHFFSLPSVTSMQP